MSRLPGAALALILVMPVAARADERGKRVSDEELQRLKEEVRIACELPPAPDARAYPWYFHYELGLKLFERQDWDRVAAALSVALDKRSDPSEHGRTYGMWFLAYRPYFHLGVAELSLGRYGCALDAFKLSRRAGELKDAPDLRSERQALEARAAQENK